MRKSNFVIWFLILTSILIYVSVNLYHCLSYEQIANACRTAPPDTMLGSAKLANKYFARFEKALNIILPYKAIECERVEPALTENIKVILQAVEK